MPGFYQGGEYDVAGFAVGAVKQEAVIDGTRIQAGDALVGFASSGVHSNGFSLVRKILEAGFCSSPPGCQHSQQRCTLTASLLVQKILMVGSQTSSLLPALQLFRDRDALHALQVSGTSLEDEVSWGSGTFGDALLAPTQIYVKRLLSLIDRVDVKVRCSGSPQNRCSLLPDHHACIAALPSRNNLYQSITSAASSLSWRPCTTDPRVASWICLCAGGHSHHRRRLP